MSSPPPFFYFLPLVLFPHPTQTNKDLAVAKPQFSIVIFQFSIFNHTSALVKPPSFMTLTSPLASFFSVMYFQ